MLSICKMGHHFGETCKWQVFRYYAIYFSYLGPIFKFWLNFTTILYFLFLSHLSLSLSLSLSKTHLCFSKIHSFTCKAINSSLQNTQTERNWKDAFLSFFLSFYCNSLRDWHLGSVHPLALSSGQWTNKCVKQVLKCSPKIMDIQVVKTLEKLF